MHYTESDRYRAAWVNASGPTAGPLPPPPAGPPEELVDLDRAAERYEAPGTGPWDGIALFDHPSNDGFPSVVGKYTTVQQITQVYYPPTDVCGRPFPFRHRVLVHDGDAEIAGVAGIAANHASACEVEVS